MELAPLVADFIRHIDVERQLSPHTVDQYGRDLREWLNYLEAEEIPLEVEEISTFHIRQFVAHLFEQRGLAAVTVKKKLACLRSFFVFACRYHGAEQNPAAAVTSPNIPERLPEVLTDQEIARLLEACDENYFRLYRVRDRAIIAVLATLGVRRQELFDIRLQDWDAHERTVRIRSGKGDRERILPLTDELVSLIKRWLDVRPATDQPWLFVSRHGHQLAAQPMQRMLRRLAEAAGLDQKIHTHMFRHYAATSIVQNDSAGGVERARRILGHASLDTLSVYTHLSVDDLRGAVRDNAARSGVTGSTRIDPQTMTVDPGTELAASRLQQVLAEFPEDWQEREEVINWLAVEWTRQCVPGDILPFPFEAVNAILTFRRTVEGLTLDQHLAVAEFGATVISRLTTRRTHVVEDVIPIGEELQGRATGGVASGEGVRAADLRRLDELLPEPDEAGVLPTIAAVVAVASRLSTYRVDIPSGRMATELLLGLLAWERGLPPLIVPAAGRILWRGLLQGSGETGTGVGYALALLTDSLADLRGR